MSNNRINSNINSIINYTILDKVKVTQILNPDEAPHLLEFIGREGYIWSWINIKGQRRYKVVVDVDTMETYYFWEGEIELIERGDKNND